mgnify:CR=1 FL=1
MYLKGKKKSRDKNQPKMVAKQERDNCCHKNMWERKLPGGSWSLLFRTILQKGYKIYKKSDQIPYKQMISNLVYWMLFLFLPPRFVFYFFVGWCFSKNVYAMLDVLLDLKAKATASTE